MAFKSEKGIYGVLSCDRCEKPIVVGITKDDVPHGEICCYLCGPIRKKEINKRRISRAA